MSLAMYTLWLRHEGTKNVATFKGQGSTIAEAVKDATSNLLYGHINPSTSGGKGTNVAPPIAVRLANGTMVNMRREDFEDGKPFEGPTPQPNPRPKTSDEVRRATAEDPKRGAHA